jgi:hypothetical protein
MEQSSDTIRNYSIYIRDLSNDGVFEIPSPKQLPRQGDSSQYWMIEWYEYDLSGERTLKYKTYHNFSDGWYLILEEEWQDKLTVRREDVISGERGIVFSTYGASAGGIEDFLVIYALSGENRNERARQAGRFELMREMDVIYAAELPKNKAGIPIDEETVRENFRIIYSDWMTGAA